MRILLDHCLPHSIRSLLPSHDVATASYLGWNRLRNGLLLAAAADAGFDCLPLENGSLLAVAGAAGFDALLTVDQGIPYQQNHVLPVAIVAVFARSNRMVDLEPLVPEVLRTLSSLTPKAVNEVTVISTPYGSGTFVRTNFVGSAFTSVGYFQTSFAGS